MERPLAIQMQIHNPALLSAHMRSCTRIPQLRNVAEWRFACEAMGNISSGTKTPAAFPGAETLRPHLANHLCNNGLAALFSRAPARAEVVMNRDMNAVFDETAKPVTEINSGDVVVFLPGSTQYNGLATGIPTCIGPRKAQQEAAPKPTAKK